MQVTVAEAPTRTVIEADSSGVHYVTEFTLTPSSADATRLAMSFTAVQDRPTYCARHFGACLAGLAPRPARR
jgi:hypothetical protein